MICAPLPLAHVHQAHRRDAPTAPAFGEFLRADQQVNHRMRLVDLVEERPREFALARGKAVLLAQPHQLGVASPTRRGYGQPPTVSAKNASRHPGLLSLLIVRVHPRCSFRKFEAISAIFPVVTCTSTAMLSLLGVCCTISHASHRPPFVSTA